AAGAAAQPAAEPAIQRLDSVAFQFDELGGELSPLPVHTRDDRLRAVLVDLFASDVDPYQNRDDVAAAMRILIGFEEEPAESPFRRLVSSAIDFQRDRRAPGAAVAPPLDERLADNPH